MYVTRSLRDVSELASWLPFLYRSPGCNILFYNPSSSFICIFETTILTFFATFIRTTGVDPFLYELKTLDARLFSVESRSTSKFGLSIVPKNYRNLSTSCEYVRKCSIFFVPMEVRMINITNWTVGRKSATLLLRLAIKENVRRFCFFT